jgi:hypothetical protein
VLTSGHDYLFFEKVDCTQQSLITTMTRGALVITRNLLAVVPHDDGDAVQFVKALLADAAVDIGKLENALTSMFSGSHSRWVFPFAQLESFKVTSGYFGMISLKLPREWVRRIVIRDRGGKAIAKAFFDELALVQDADRGGQADRSIGG